MTTNAGTANEPLYLVGGAVRDHLMGKQPKDFDFSIEVESFDAMREWLVRNDFTIFLETPQYFTIRARRKNPWVFAGFNMSGLTFDFVMARRDGSYSDGRRPDEVTPGTIYDDLARRDFTINAMAMSRDGSILDPHKGQRDLALSNIRCVNGVDRLFEDGLRMLRALRFSVQLGFKIGILEAIAMSSAENMKYLEPVSQDRIRDELTKCFKADIRKTIHLLEAFPEISRTVFEGTDLWLKPTSEKR